MRKHKHMKESHEWDDFDFPTLDNFLPSTGEGSTKAAQIATAVSKIIYRWFNDGDYYNNTPGLTGGMTDLSSYANWLYYNLPGAKDILNKIENVGNEDDYTDLLFELGTLAEDTINAFETTPSVESVYDCDGPFEFREPLTCPECGNEMDEYEDAHYGMCYDCFSSQPEDDFNESVNRKASKLREDEEKSPEFTDDELQLIADRIGVEVSCGSDVYSSNALKTMKSILSKLKDLGFEMK